MAPPSPWPFVLKSPIELNIWTIIFLTDSSISVGKVICLCLPHPGLFNSLLHLFSITIYPLLPLPLAPVETVFSKRHNSWLPTTWTGIALLTSPIIFPSSPAPAAPSLTLGISLREILLKMIPVYCHMSVTFIILYYFKILNINANFKCKSV